MPRETRLGALLFFGALLASCGGPEDPPPPAETPPMDTVEGRRDVVIVSAGPSRLQVTKALREVTGLGLAEAKAQTDTLPAVVLEGVTPERAQAAARTLEQAGAKVELRPR